MFHSFSQDARSLELLLNILGGVEPDFVKASEASVAGSSEAVKETDH